MTSNFNAAEIIIQINNGEEKIIGDNDGVFVRCEKGKLKIKINKKAIIDIREITIHPAM